MTTAKSQNRTVLAHKIGNWLRRNSSDPHISKLFAAVLAQGFQDLLDPKYRDEAYRFLTDMENPYYLLCDLNPKVVADMANTLDSLPAERVDDYCSRWREWKKMDMEQKRRELSQHC